jgi:hypothetical protein
MSVAVAPQPYTAINTSCGRVIVESDPGLVPLTSPDVQKRLKLLRVEKPAGTAKALSKHKEALYSKYTSLKEKGKQELEKMYSLIRLSCDKVRELAVDMKAIEAFAPELEKRIKKAQVSRPTHCSHPSLTYFVCRKRWTEKLMRS